MSVDGVGSRRTGPCNTRRAVRRLPGQFRELVAAGSRAGVGGSAVVACEGNREPCARGDTTPIEITYFNASSTVMSRSRTRERGTMMKYPEVGLGVVGT